MSKTETMPTSLDTLPFRTPVIDTPVDQTAINRGWHAATEAMRRGITADLATRHAAISFIDTPLSEALPVQALTTYGELDARVQRIGQRHILRSYVSLAVVPDAFLTPDIQHAPRLTSRSQAEKELQWAADFDNRHPESGAEQVSNTFEVLTAKLDKNPGVTHDERRLVANRYRMARDVKLLALGAELIDTPPAMTEIDGTLHGDLPSGTHVAVDKAALESTPELLKPETWLKRRQLKDRVHGVRVGDRVFIMKERKTARHTDTKAKGHRDGLTSAQEYATAQHFNKLGPIYQDGVKLTWEKPIGYVEFPDGFQFCLFEADPRIADQAGNTVDALAVAPRILAEPASYQDEFTRIQVRAKQIYDDRADVLMPEYRSKEPKLSKRPLKRRGQKRALAKLETPSDPISFDEFALMKARTTDGNAWRVLSDALLGQGYHNSDLDGYAVLPSADPKALIDMIGFDFEYYEHAPNRAAGLNAHRTEIRNNGSGIQIGIYAGDNLARERMNEATGLALLEEMGFNLPAKID